jgi:hypothetical protein
MEDFDYFSPTNTMASTPFDVLKMDGIEDPLIDINKLATLDLQESYFAECVRFVNESNKSITDAKMTLYKNIYEASTDTVVLESFSDFFAQIKAIIDKFLKFIKSLFDRFIANLNKAIKSDKFIKKNKDVIRQFNSDCEFDMTGYTFTFNREVPVSSAIIDITSDMFSDLKEAPSGDLNAEYVKNLASAMSYDDQWYDNFRGKVMGKNDEYIEAGDFQEELFRAFRDDSLETENIVVDSTIVMEALRRFENYKETEKQTRREQKDIENAYNDLKNTIRKLSNKGSVNLKAITGYIGDTSKLNTIDGTKSYAASATSSGFAVSSELGIAFDLFTKAKCDQVQRCSDIHVLAYGAKLDALKDCLKQDRATLYTAYNMVRKRGVDDGRNTK